ncbi:hypothetical protein ACVIHH_008119 [Bradyrhizobium sp. USDA 4518]
MKQIRPSDHFQPADGNFTVALSAERAAAQIARNRRSSTSNLKANHDLVTRVAALSIAERGESVHDVQCRWRMRPAQQGDDSSPIDFRNSRQIKVQR